MKKNHFRIYLNKDHKNDYCDILALQAAEINANKYTMTAEQFHHIIERNLLESGREGIEATFDDVGNQIFIDVKQADGRHATGLLLVQVELIELNPENENN